MTQAEFNEAQRIARKNYLVLQRRTAREIHNIYVSAADNIARIIKKLETTGKGDSLTAASYRELQKALTAAGKEIISGVEPIITEAVSLQADLTGAAHSKYIKDGLTLSGLATDKVSGEVIASMYAAVNKVLVELTYNRLIDGYTFKQKIQSLLTNWSDDVVSVLTSGFAQGRDVIDIAVDLQKYARGGKAQIIHRYGEIERGTKQFIKRIPKNLDYRALRLARSELYASLQDTERIQGRLNPAVYEYIWNLTAGAEHVCICPDLAADSPYQWNNVPDYPHSNCYKEGTEVYTKRGWIDFRYVNKNDIFLSLNPNTHNVEWEFITDIQKFKITDDLVQIKSKWFELVTTKNHRNYVKAGGSYRWMTSEELHNLKYSYVSIPRACKWEGISKKFINMGKYEIKSEDYCRFMAYYLSDGCVSNNSNNSGMHGIIARSREKGKKYIFNQLKKLPFKINLTKDGFTFYDLSICKYLQQFGKSKDKYIPDEIKEMDSDLIKIFLEAYSICDGYKATINTEFKNIKSSTISFFTISKRLSDDIGELILKTGGHPSYSEIIPKKIKFKNGEYQSKHNLYLIRWNRSKAAYKHKDDPQKGLKTELVEYSGYVYDVTLQKNHILWVRYNGKTCFSGNCLCWITHRLLGRDEFVNDLIDWGKGLEVPYLSQWYQDIYLPYELRRIIPA